MTSSDEDIRRAFLIFKRDEHGMISTEELRRVLTGSGERLTHAEVDEFFYEAKIKDKISYEALVTLMLEN